MVKLEDFTNTELKAIARKYNKVAKIAGYSKLKKDELIKKIRGHPNLNVSETEKGVKIKVVGSDLGNVDKVVKEKKPRKPREPKPKKPEPKPEEPKPKKPEPKPKKPEPKPEEPKPKKPEDKIDFDIPYEKTLYKSLYNYSKGDPVNFACFNGMSFYLFLEVMLRNKNDCILGSGKDLFENFNMGQSVYGIGIKDFKSKSQEILNKYEECAKRKKILVYPVFKVGHANMLVFNYTLNQIEYYEPHGKGTKGYENAIMNLVKYFNKNGKTKFSKTIKFSPSVKSCPLIPKSSLKIFQDNQIQVRENKGLQIYDGTPEQKRQKIKTSSGKLFSDTGGFCCMWSFLYMDFRLKNPTSPTNQLGNDLMKMIKGNPREFFRKYIRGYTFDIMERLSNTIGDDYLYALNHLNSNVYRNNKEKINKRVKNILVKIWNEAGGK